jgi:uncharacterized protein
VAYTYNNKNKELTLSAESVAAYLTSNPDFFTHNPALLKKISISHALTGNVQSLIERQVGLLREDNNEFKKLIKKNNALSKTQHYLLQHIYQFTFELLNTKTEIELYRLLKLNLGKWFSASWVKLLIFESGRKTGHIGGIHCLKNESRLRFMFIEMLNRNKPLCSSLQTEQIQMLFNKDADKVKSNLIIPIRQGSWYGLFVLGSNERNQYGVGGELDMLVFISQLLSFKLQELWNP